MHPLTYEEILDKIQNQRRFGNLPGVEVSGRMLESLGNPQTGMSVIHVAGTNGKGSVSAFLCSVLKEAGLRTGMFTSPHLVDFEERIQIDGRMITKEDVTRLGNLLLSEEYEVTPTMFDYCLGMAMLYFKEQNCDAVILETGLGGRLDSTNAVGTPVVSVITKIGYHQKRYLPGDRKPGTGGASGDFKGSKAGKKLSGGESLRIYGYGIPERRAGIFLSRISEAADENVGQPPVRECGGSNSGSRSIF